MIFLRAVGKECVIENELANSEVSEEFSNLDERLVEEGWVLLADMSKDRRRDPKSAYAGIYSGLNPPLGPAPCAAPGDCYQYPLLL